MLKLGAREYRVIVCDYIREPKGNEPDRRLAGMFSSEAGTIQVAEASSPGPMVEAFCHEILHAMFNMTPLNLSESKEEQLVVALTPWFHAFLAQNADLAADIGAGIVRGDEP